MVDSEDDRGASAREAYLGRLLSIRGAFDAAADRGDAGLAAVRARSSALDALVEALWADEAARDARLGKRVAVIALGGFGRQELYPCSDVDVLFLLDAKFPEKEAKDSIRRVSQRLWDVGARAAPVTRTVAECERFDPENAESTLALLDARVIWDDGGLFTKLQGALTKLIGREGPVVMVKLAELARNRYAKYGGTLFHLEPNIKDCPGGLRDVHLCGWMLRLRAGTRSPLEGVEGKDQEALADEDFRRAFSFLTTVRCFLHYRRERDDNTLDWQAQDEAAEYGIGLRWERGESSRAEGSGDASYWMRAYFRHARIVHRRALQAMSEVPAPRGLLPRLRRGVTTGKGFRLEQGRATLNAVGERGDDLAGEPHVVLALFGEMARSGFVLARETEDRLSQAIGSLSAHLEEGPALWSELRAILTGRYAGDTLRAMHALGVLELLIPEFHGIDALVVRDAYHRYTVDEHTFVLIDTLHGLDDETRGPAGDWTASFAHLLRELPHPELLFLAALLHDTGKGRSTGLHAAESERMARSVAGRLELDGLETELVAGLVRHHLEMSAALRRDIFDAQTVRAFAAKVQTTEALRMLTLFTYADIDAVHPAALTPWKAENLWQLFIATANSLDRSVDEERVSAASGGELIHRVAALVPDRRAEIEAYLEGFPERYLRTRTAEQVRMHFEMASGFAIDPVQLDFRYGPNGNEITLVTRDRELLFATMAGALAAWGMNIVTADAFSNARAVVVDTFRFTDSFRTLEMNESERGAFVRSVKDVLTGAQDVEKLLAARRRGKRATPKVGVTAKVEFDGHASTQSTLVQVVAQDTPGLLRALSLTFAHHGCNVAVALVDTEGEMAIDVFYLSKGGAKLDADEQAGLKIALLDAMQENAHSG